MRRVIPEQDYEVYRNRVGKGDVGTRNDARSTRGMPLHRNVAAGSNPAPSPIFHYQLSMTGQVPSGKNQVQMLWRRGNIQRVPNKTFTNWRSSVGMQLLTQEKPIAPLSTPIRLICDYWPKDRCVRDVSGNLDAIFSMLVYAHIVKNDGLIYDVIWRRHEMNRKYPKLIMELEPW